MAPALSWPVLPLGWLLLCRALDQCADPTAPRHDLFFLPNLLCMCPPFNCSHTSLLEETLVTDADISGCAFCVMHVVAIPDHRTQILFAQSLLPYLHLSQTYKVLRHALRMVTQRDWSQLPSLSWIVYWLLTLSSALFGNTM